MNKPNCLHELQESSPFFILGNPRSGTSMFRMMLNSHQDISVPPECGFLEWLAKDFGSIAITPDVYKNFAESVYHAKKFETWQISYDSLLATIAYYQPKDYRELCLCVYLTYAHSSGKDVSLVGDKNNYYLDKLDLIQQHFPDSKKIFIVRDGRDVACSYLQLKQEEIKPEYFPNLTSEIPEIAKEWARSAALAKAFQKRGALVILYEKLLDEPKTTLSIVCDYLGVGFSETMLEFSKFNDEPASFLKWKGKTTQALQADNKGKYKEILMSEQISEFEQIAHEMLKIFGYEIE